MVEGVQRAEANKVTWSATQKTIDSKSICNIVHLIRPLGTCTPSASHTLGSSRCGSVNARALMCHRHIIHSPRDASRPPGRSLLIVPSEDEVTHAMPPSAREVSSARRMTEGVQRAEANKVTWSATGGQAPAGKVAVRSTLIVYNPPRIMDAVPSDTGEQLIQALCTISSV